MAEFRDQARVDNKKASTTVGVYKPDDVYKKPIPPHVANKFWGIDNEEMAEDVRERQFEDNKDAFFCVDRKAGPKTIRVKKETEDEAMRKFFGVEEQEYLERGKPIPGYSGTVRRVQADNVFGMTYAQAMERAHESLDKNVAEKGETLMMNSKFVESYKRNKGEEDWF